MGSLNIRYLSHFVSVAGLWLALGACQPLYSHFAPPNVMAEAPYGYSQAFALGVSFYTPDVTIKERDRFPLTICYHTRLLLTVSTASFLP